MIYVTSDLHGYSLESVKSLLAKASFSGKDRLYVLGDVIDRGDDGIKTLKWLMAQPNAKLILGNHEDMMLNCHFLFDDGVPFSLKNMNKLSKWTSNGGRVTFSELIKMNNSEALNIMKYLEKAPLYETVCANNKKFLLTHSGIGGFKKEKKLSEYSAEDFLWNRPEINQSYFDDVITVLGHTPTLFYGERFKGKTIITESWINIDTGAALGLSPMLLRLDDLKEFYLEE